MCEKDRVVLTASGRFFLCTVSESDELESDYIHLFSTRGFQ